MPTRRRSLLLSLALIPGMMTAHVLDTSKLTDVELSTFKPVSDGIQHATSIVLYEGLPHPTWERTALEQELASKKTISIHTLPFYEAPLAISAADADSLAKLASDAESFSAYVGEKLCGAFHADYAATWKIGDESYTLMVCFTCHEAQIFGPAQNLRVEVRETAFPRFKALLGKYRAQRPVTK